MTHVMKFWITAPGKFNEKIVKASFTNMKEDFFIVTERGRIKKYKLNENTN